MMAFYAKELHTLEALFVNNLRCLTDDFSCKLFNQFIIYMNKQLVAVCILCIIFLVSVFAINNNHKNIKHSDSLSSTTIKASTTATDYQPKETNSLQGLLMSIKQEVQQGIKIINGLLNIFNSSSNLASVASGAAPFNSPAYYQYKITDAHFRQKIETARRITQIEKYSSPQTEKDAFLSHHEIAIQLDHLIWVLLSFEKEGIQAKLAFSSEEIVQPGSTLIEAKRVNASAKRLLDFLKRYDGQEYHLLLSNRRDVSQVLWDAILQ